MEVPSYSVFLNLKISGLTKAFHYLAIGSFVMVVLFGFYLLPSYNSPDEMKAAYFVLTTSDFEKVMFSIGIVGAPTFFILYRKVRIKKQAILTLYPDKIEIDNYKMITSYPIAEITDIACNDAMTMDGSLTCQLTIDLKDVTNKITSLTLADYNESPQLMNYLLNYDTVKFSVTNFLNDPEALNSN